MNAKKIFYVDPNAKARLNTMAEAVRHWLDDHTEPDPEGFIPMKEVLARWLETREPYLPSPRGLYEGRQMFYRSLTHLGYKRAYLSRGPVLLGLRWRETGAEGGKPVV